MKSLDEIVDRASTLNIRIMAVAKAEDEAVLKALKLSQERMPVKSILVGSKNKIEAKLKQLCIETNRIEIIHEDDPRSAAKIAASLAKQGKAQMLVKGLLTTKDFLIGVLSEDKTLVDGNLLSHVAVFEVPGFKRLLVLSDAAVNINPDANQKYSILNNSLIVAKSLGIHSPRVALLSAVEDINISIPSTVDAALICKMAHRKWPDLVIDGPLALDIAVSKEAVNHKNIVSPVGGIADVLITPDLVSGNILYKSLVYFAGAKAAGIVLGAKIPIVLTSRADKDESKVYSIALGLLTADYLKLS
ncbi:MAG: bifunctional enoyl-CoA hydratase/phosphate acetyltransferase [Tepidanaerobacteraceae bacterium]